MKFNRGSIITALSAWALFAGIAGAEVPANLGAVRYTDASPLFSMPVPEGELQLRAVSDSVIEVKVTPTGARPKYKSVTVIHEFPVKTTLTQKDGQWLFSAGKITASVDGKTGCVRFLDNAGNEILAETPGGRAFTSNTVNGEASVTPQQSFAAPADESLYGLGQHQDGRLDWHGETLRLRQVNTEISMPILWSTKSYGLLWDNPSDTWFNPGEDVPLNDRRATVHVTESGDYSFYVNNTSLQHEITILVDGQPIVSLENFWLPYGAGGHIKLEANTDHQIEVRAEGDARYGGLKLTMHNKSLPTVWRSRMGEAIDYYVIYGSTPNEIIANYRAISGQVPMLTKSAWGYWQCRERYASSNELIEAVEGFRKRQIPVDVIVQDWRYWEKYGFNAMKWDERFYPDPVDLTTRLHAMHTKLINSVWSKFDPQTDVRKDEEKNGGMVPGTEWFDAFNPKARQIYWKHMNAGLFSVGVDGFWQDATEPESDCLLNNKIYLGESDVYLNSYPLFVNRAVYEGQRSTSDAKRVTLITRSGYPGQQRYGTVSWSGDVRSSWASYQKQLPAGLGFASAGMPYWTTDIGGFFRPGVDQGPPGNQYTSPEYHELLCRWLECGTFYPIQRLHGWQSRTEPWNYGPEVERIITKFIKLRYQFLPYTYSTDWQIHANGATLMRALPMDFPQDMAVRDIKDEFLYGPSLLVAPIMGPQHPQDNGTAALVPSSSLFGPDRKTAGLVGTYFKGNNFDQKIQTRTDKTIDFNWTNNEPLAGLGTEHYSVRWEGFVKAENAGDYQFTVTGNDGFRLWVDDKNICEDWNARSTLTKSGTIHLAGGGVLVPIKLEYFQDTSDAVISLQWTPADKTDTVVNGSRRTVIFPAEAQWYDFWTGKSVGAGPLQVVAPLDALPLYVRAGSILPFGPVLQYTAQKSSIPIELRVYPGADATFDLYDDAGDSYGYEKGQYAISRLTWNDKSRQFVIGARKGHYPGMAETCDYLVRVLQSDGTWKDTRIQYKGQELTIHADESQPQSAELPPLNIPLHREATEWVDIRTPDEQKTNLPHVLLIGDSISRGYFNVVQDKLAGKAYCDLLATSRGICDPVLCEQILGLLNAHQFAVIHFNNGLHGADYSATEYETGFKYLLATLERESHGAKLVWATSTSVRPGFTSWNHDDAFNARMVDERNAIGRRLTRAAGIPCDDLNIVTRDHPEYYIGDKIHYNDTGWQKLGASVVKAVLPELPG
jgi:alpha-D-xyloside xylohydrolase